MNPKKLNLAFLGVGFVLLIFLLRSLDFSYVASFDYTFTLFNVTALIAILFIIFAVRTLRWMQYLRAIQVKISFWEAYHLVVPSIALALFTPAQSGDILKIEFLKHNKGVKRRDSFATFFVEKLMDFSLIFLVFCISVFYLSVNSLGIQLSKIIPLLVVLVIAGVAVFFFLLKKRKAVVQKILRNTKEILSKPSVVVSTLLLTAAYWIVVCFNWVLVAEVTHIDVPFFLMFGILSIGTIIGIISFIPGALGVMEFSTVFLLHTFAAVSIEQATLFAVSYRLYTLLLYVVAYLHALFKA